MPMNVEGKKGKGRSKNKWLDTIENGIRAVGVCLGEEEIETKVKTKSSELECPTSNNQEEGKQEDMFITKY